MLKIIIILFLIFSSESCKNNSHSNPSNNISSVGPIRLHNVDSINGVWPEFVGKFKEDDSIHFVNLDTVNYEGVFVDTDLSELDKIPNATYGFDVIAYYDRRIPSNFSENASYWYYPVYVLNNSSEDRFFTLKDNYVFAIQEALHPNGNWYPIEKRGLDDCLNGRWSIKVKPQEYLVFLMSKYQGEFKTKIRVRLKIGRMIYYSQPFDGYLNQKQFLGNRESLHQIFNSESDFARDYLFYEAVPFQVNER